MRESTLHRLFAVAAVVAGAGSLSFSFASERASSSARVLRVCADPNNRPYSSAQGDGFEDELAKIVARELGATVDHTYFAQRRGFFRQTLKARKCDVVMGVPKGIEPVLTTRPYYRSSYVFVWKKERALDVQTLADPRLRDWKIGVPVVGDDGASTPPGGALARRGIISNVVGYTVYGDYRDDAPAAEIVRAVARGDVDVAIVWGPIAGPFARDLGLAISPVLGATRDDPPMSFEIAMGVRHGDEALRNELDAVLARVKPEIDALLARRGVPTT